MNREQAEKQALEQLMQAYMAALKMSHASVCRIRHQNVLCVLRDAIAEELGQTAEEVQNSFEAMELKLRLAA